MVIFTLDREEEDAFLSQSQEELDQEATAEGKHNNNTSPTTNLSLLSSLFSLLSLSLSLSFSLFDTKQTIKMYKLISLNI